MKKLLLCCAFICFPVFSLSSEEVLESFKSKDFEKILTYMNSYEETESLLLNNLGDRLEKLRDEDNDPLSIIALFHTYKLIVEKRFEDIEGKISVDLLKKLGMKKSIVFFGGSVKSTKGNLSPSEINFTIPINTKSFRHMVTNAFAVKLEQWFAAKHTWYGERNLTQDKELLFELLSSETLAPPKDWNMGLKKVSQLCFIYFIALLSTEEFVSQHFKVIFDGVTEFSKNGQFFRGDVFYNYPELVGKTVYFLALTNEDLKEKGAEPKFSECREYVSTRLLEIFNEFTDGSRVSAYIATFARVMGVYIPRLTKNADSGIKSFE